ncbi:MAG: nitric-oxide reductase large subunit, partial [Castellaniella sp.]
MGEYKKLWWTLIGVLVVSFGILGWMGKEVYQQAPPIPGQIATASGQVLMTEEQILDGQVAYQTAGGMTVGSILGHGAYQAPDWTADWLHRELTAWLDLAAQERFGLNFDQLDGDNQAILQRQLKA